MSLLRKEAKAFAQSESSHPEPSLFGVTDGKAVGTYFEHKFKKYLHTKYQYEEGNTAKGVDFPTLEVDVKVTSVKQPQSSCPFKTAFMRDRMLPVDDIEAGAIAQDLIEKPPEVGYLTISNALQWRLQYKRVIEKAGHVDGVLRVR